MQTLTTLSDSELLNKTLAIAKQEQNYSLQLIEHLIEVDARKLFATLGHDSLFKYVVRDLGYSESTAYERIRAMRLVRVIPEVREKIQSGALTLSSAAQVESFRRQEKLPEAATAKLIEEASHKSLREVEILLLSKSENPIPKERLRQITPELQEVRLVLTPDLQVLIRRYEELNGKAPVSEILQTVLEDHLEKHDPLRKASRLASDGTTRTSPESQPSTGPSNPSAVSAKLCVTPGKESSRLTPSRYIAADTKREIWRRSQGRCEWRDPKSQGRCISRFKLQFDHYPKPFGLGGASTHDNLRQVCPAHNARFAVEIYGARRA